MRDTAERLATLRQSLSDIQDAGRIEELTTVPDGAFSVMVTPDPSPIPPGSTQ